jgi:hypothetical protein
MLIIEKKKRATKMKNKKGKKTLLRKFELTLKSRKERERERKKKASMWSVG